MNIKKHNYVMDIVPINTTTNFVTQLTHCFWAYRTTPPSLFPRTIHTHTTYQLIYDLINLSPLRFCFNRLKVCFDIKTMLFLLLF